MQGGMAKLREEFAGLGKGLGFWLDFSRFQGGGGWLELPFTRLKMNDLELKIQPTRQQNKRLFSQSAKYQQDTNT